MKNIKVGDKVRITGHNVTNSAIMNEKLEKNFPIGEICTVVNAKVPYSAIPTREKSKKKSFSICDPYNLDFCKTTSEDKCISIMNSKEEITHICYVSIEKM